MAALLMRSVQTLRRILWINMDSNHVETGLHDPIQIRRLESNPQIKNKSIGGGAWWKGFKEVGGRVFRQTLF